MHYPWGTTDEIPQILGIPADGRPYAEYWLGAHLLGTATVGDRRLDELVAAEPALLGDAAAFGRLPYLMKLLSARKPLSLQAHPSREKAEEGFARENADDIPVDDPVRTYRDDWPKPELMVALHEPFHTLVGFRRPAQTAALFRALGVPDLVLDVIAPLVFRSGAAGTEEVFLDVLGMSGDRLDVVNHVLAAAANHLDDPGELGQFARTTVELDESFPGDPGIMAALLMNRVALQPGEAVFIPTGALHAHLSGTGVEVMASSDNIIRGGLTTKHIAVDELVSVVDFHDSVPQVFTPGEERPGVFHYPTGCPEFDVYRLEIGDGAQPELPREGAVRIALATAGCVELRDADGVLTLRCGQGAFLPASDGPVTAVGSGELFLACPGA